MFGSRGRGRFRSWLCLAWCLLLIPMPVNGLRMGAGLPKRESVLWGRLSSSCVEGALLGTREPLTNTGACGFQTEQPQDHRP